MKIIVSQQDKKILIEFYSDARHRRGRSPDYSVGVDKAENFLDALDRFIKKRKMNLKSLSKVKLEFHNVGILTERIIRAIISGLRF